MSDSYEAAYNEVMARTGVAKGACKMCGAAFYAEFEYQKRGSCGPCVMLLAHEYSMAHSGEPAEFFSTPEQIAEFAANRPARIGFRKAEISPSLRKRVLERDAYRCQICGDYHELHIDHVYPESKGGATSIENLQVLCGPCNIKKGSTVP